MEEKNYDNIDKQIASADCKVEQEADEVMYIPLAFGVIVILGIAIVDIGPLVDNYYKNEKNNSNIEIVNINELNLQNDSSYRIIETVNNISENNYYFAKKIKFSYDNETLKYNFGIKDNDNSFSNNVSQEEYFIMNSKSDGYVYVDLNSLKPIAYAYDIDNKTNYIYSSNSLLLEKGENDIIIKDEDAYDYVYQYLGEKDSYTLDDMNDLVGKIKNNDTVKVKALTK